MVVAFVEEAGEGGGLTDPFRAGGEEGRGGYECGVERVCGGVGEAAFGVCCVLSGGVVVEGEHGESDGRRLEGAVA